MKYASLLFWISVVVPCAAHAGTMEYRRWDSDPHDVVMAPLRASFSMHARAAARWLLDGQDVSRLTRHDLDLFDEQFLDATFVAAHYTYRHGESDVTRVYYAMSGNNEPWAIESDAGRSRYVAEGIFLEDVAVVSTRRPFSEYMRVPSGAVWAHAEPGEKTSIESGAVNANDIPTIYTGSAEFKAMRSIERDIQAGLVPSHGNVAVFASRKPCQACDVALRNFALRYAGGMWVNMIDDPGTWISRRFLRDRQAFMMTVRASLPSRWDLYPVRPSSPGAGQCAASIR